MMNAEVTAENRPACEPSQHVTDTRNTNTYEDQSGVQVFVVPLDELSVVLLRFAVVHLIELCSVILRGRRRVWFLTAREFNF